MPVVPQKSAGVAIALELVLGLLGPVLAAQGVERHNSVAGMQAMNGPSF